MSGDVSAPPWLLIGVEGVTGTAVCTVLLYPLCWILPGNDHGSFEDPLNTAAKLYNSPTALAFALLFCAFLPGSALGMLACCSKRWRLRALPPP